jgi:environmental stress-induced protein Ves
MSHTATAPCHNVGMIILRETNYITVPWKNGGGITREILREPLQSDTFAWRLSLATIDSPGPFSLFEGYHRTLILVRGAGVELNFTQHGRSKLTTPGQTVSFDGAWQTSCTLLDGPSTDLNLIVSKETAQSASRSVQLTAAEVIETADWSEVLVCCISGAVKLGNAAGAREILSGNDVARCSPGDGAITCGPHGPIAPNVFVAGLRRRNAS